MSKRMRVEEVALDERDRRESWIFGATVVVLQGPVGVGKTSLMELIKYVLGGRGILSKTIKDVGVRVVLRVAFEAGRFVLVRSIGSGSNQVRIVTDDGEPVAVLPVHPASPRDRTISHWLLEQLDIPAGVRLPRSRANPRDEITQISFGDVFSFMYLDQSEIDRSTARDLDPILDPKRRQTFELLYGLLGPEEASLSVQIAKVRSAIRESLAAEQSIADFVSRLDIPSVEELAERRAQLRGALADVERSLSIARREAGVTTQSIDLPRGHVDAVRAELGRAQAQRRLVAQEIEALTRLRSRIALEYQKTARALVAGGVFASSAWEVCPRCLQTLEIEHPVLHCVLCGQLEPPEMPPDELEAEQDRLRQQLAETDELVVRAQNGLDSADRRGRELATRLATYEDEIDVATREAVAPFVDRIADLTGDAARLGAQLAETDRLERLNSELVSVRQARGDLQARLAELEDDLERAKDHAELGRARVLELSEIFAETLQRFEQPWFEEQGGEAHIDPTNYRPVVNGQYLPEQLSGGMKVVTNLAYYLAGLTFALRAPAESRLPTFLMIDTPRKNFGSSPEDRRASERFYADIHALRGLYGDRMQIIIADNDVPVRVRRGLRIRTFDYESPLIPSVEHPGEGKVATLSGRS